MEYTQQPLYYIISLVRIRYYIETVIQIFKTYTETRLRRYISIISRILADSYRMNKKEYGLYVFIESLYSGIRESYWKYIPENFVMYSPVFCPNTGKYIAKKMRYSRWFYVVLWSVILIPLSRPSSFEFLLKKRF